MWNIHPVCFLHLTQIAVFRNAHHGILGLSELHRRCSLVVLLYTRTQTQILSLSNTHTLSLKHTHTRFTHTSSVPLSLLPPFLFVIHTHARARAYTDTNTCVRSLRLTHIHARTRARRCIKSFFSHFFSFDNVCLRETDELYVHVFLHYSFIDSWVHDLSKTSTSVTRIV